MKKHIMRTVAMMLVLIMTWGIVPAVAEDLNIVAEAAIVIDFNTGEILFERDAHTPRVPASMTKAMTAFVVYEEMERGNLTLETLVPISENASRVSRDTTMQGLPFPLAVGSYHTVDTLLHLAMLPSSNGACVALAEFISGTEAAFAQRMNESAAAIGMWSEFTNSHGAIAHYTNAYSIGRLMYEFIHRFPDILRITGAEYYVFEDEPRYTTNLLLRTMPYEGADGFRTGTTREAGWCLAATAYRNGRRIIVVVMNTPNNNRRYGDSIRLLDFGFAEAARRDAAREAERIAAEVARYASRIAVVVNGAHVTTRTFPRTVDNRAMVPAREFFEALGAVEYREEHGIINMNTYDGRAVSLAVEQIAIFVDGRSLFIIPPRIIDGEIFIAVRYAAYALGLAVEWDGATRTVIVG